jgi:DNA-binding phage protein
MNCPRRRPVAESFYKALSADGNPELATVLKVIALGLKLTLAPNHHAA